MSFKEKLKDHFTKELFDALIEKHASYDLYVDYYGLLGDLESHLLSSGYGAVHKNKAQLAQMFNLNRTTLVMKMKKRFG